MREEILKILEMQASGKLTPEQATELIVALNEGDAATKTQTDGTQKSEEPAAGFSSEFSTDNLGEFIQRIIQGAIQGKIGTVKGKFGPAKVKFSDEDGEGNRINASKIEMPKGDDFEFRNNHINLSSVTGLEMEHSSEFCDNRIQASTLNSLHLSTAIVTDVSINGSSLDNIKIEDSELTDLKFSGCKITRLELKDDCTWSDAQFNGCTIKEARFEGGELSDIQWHGTAFAKSHWKSVLMSDLQIHGSQFQDCHLEDCEFSDAKFRGCRFVNCEIKDVTMSDFALADVDFSNQKIKGTEAFKNFLRSQGGNQAD